MTDQALVELAFTMLEKSYVPYSRFPVGAALEGTDGTVYTGCNVENAAYGSTLCAERTALVKAISEGCRSFTRLAVVGNSADYCWPCGACRQMLYEFAPDLEVLVARQDHTFVKYTLRQLLPRASGRTPGLTPVPITTPPPRRRRRSAPASQRRYPDGSARISGPYEFRRTRGGRRRDAPLYAGNQ
ncbi:MAG: cytidine deaminase [Evtepia gabavorous]